jgi:hypothetical protein
VLQPALPVLAPVDATALELAAMAAAQEQAAAPAAPAAEDPAAPRRRRWRPKGWNLKEIIGSPIVWRELRKPLLRDKVVQIVATCAVLFYLLYAYAILGASGVMSQGGTQAFFVTMFLLAGMFCTAVDSATCIAPERSARTWPSLLSTPLSDWHILLGKAGGTAFRCVPVWLFLAGHVVVFVVLGVLHPIVLVHVLLLAVGVNVFLLGSGVYFSVRTRRATAAVLMSVGLPLLLWGMVPAGAGLVGEVFGDRELYDTLMAANPIVQSMVVVSGGCIGHGSPADPSPQPAYDWPDWPRHGGMTTLIVLGTFAGHCLAGLFMAWRAKRLFRRNVFEG